MTARKRPFKFLLSESSLWELGSSLLSFPAARLKWNLGVRVAGPGHEGLASESPGSCPAVHRIRRGGPGRRGYHPGPGARLDHEGFEFKVWFSSWRHGLHSGLDRH